MKNLANCLALLALLPFNGYIHTCLASPPTSLPGKSAAETCAELNSLPIEGLTSTLKGLRSGRFHLSEELGPHPIAGTKILN